MRQLCNRERVEIRSIGPDRAIAVAVEGEMPNLALDVHQSFNSSKMIEKSNSLLG